jgi:dTDP-4-amino-4,6-dideoxygalactose transaminase
MENSPMLTRRMPVYPVRKQPEVLEAVMRRLREADWTRLEGAPETDRALEAYHGGGTAWFIASGTAALEALLLGHGIGYGDEVITTPYTWGATVSAILAVGAIPVFADIDPIGAQMDVATVERLIGKRTKAILAVHLFGYVAPVEQLRTVADAHGILLLEDGSQAHGARIRGRPIGLSGHGAAFSCMGLKLLAGTEGGYALFSDAQTAERAKLYGQHPRGLEAEQVERLEAAGLLDTLQLGWRPCSVSAELVRAKLPYLDAEVAARRENMAQLRAALAGSLLQVAEDAPGTVGACHLLSVCLPDGTAGQQRSAFLACLADCGVEAFVYIPTPIHRMRRLNPHDYDGPPVMWHPQLLAAGVDYRDSRCPSAEWRSRHSVEMAFNWTEVDPQAMAQLADCLLFAAQNSFRAV